MNGTEILFIVECYWGSGHMNVTAELARAFQEKGASVSIAASESSFAMGSNFDSEFSAQMNDMNAQGFPVYGLARDVLGYPEPRENVFTNQPDYTYHDARAVDFVNDHFHAVFIAGDQNTARLEDSLDPSAFSNLAVGHHYIGYIGAGDMPVREVMPDSARPLLITGGGTYKGAVRTHMRNTVAAIAAAKPLTDLAQNPLLVVVGAEAQTADLAELSALAQTASCPFEVVRTMPSAQFRKNIANAALVVGKGSRNATVECAQALERGPVGHIITPMRDETGIWPETRIRAQAFARAGLSVTLEEATPEDTENNARVIQQALACAQEKFRKGFRLDLSGAKKMADLFMRMYGPCERPSPPRPA